MSDRELIDVNLRTETEIRARILAVARSWLGTNFVDCACLKGHGVDCAQLLPAIAIEAGIYKNIELPNYSPQVYMHKKADGSWDHTYLDVITKYAREIEEHEVQPGDFVIYKQYHSYTHGGIIERWPEAIIHPIRPHGVIYSDAREGFLKGRAKKFFSVFPLRDSDDGTSR